MPTIKTGWLENKNGEKFAPKTLSSQVQTSDGVLLEDKIQENLDAHISDATKHITSDERTNWNATKTTADDAKTRADSAYTLAEGKVSPSALSSYYTKTEIDNYEFITVNDIDTICSATIEVATASEVTF